MVEPCDAFIAISGAGLTTGPEVQAAGGKFICDRGSTHKRFQDRILAEEYRRWGVRERDSARLTLRLQQTADDPVLRERMAAAALARVQSLGGWDHYGDQWDRLLHALTGQPQEPE